MWLHDYKTGVKGVPQVQLIDKYVASIYTTLTTTTKI
jgi:hypothetical protein